MPEGQVLEFTHVTKRFNEVTAVSDFSARVEPGAVTAFLGPNGAGKTTTLRILLGQVRATSGTATIGGTAYAELRQPLRTIGAVLEETVYRPRRTAERQLTIAAKANGIPLARVGEVLSLVGLEGEGDSRIGGFSLGMRQRLSVAHALLGDPGALVFDEPANGLDPEGIRWMRLLMRRLADEGRTVLVSSHVLSEVEQVADNVLVLSKGTLVLASGIETLADTKGGSVVVDAADRAALTAALTAAGFDIEVLRSGLTVRGGDAGTVGAVAADAGIALSTLVQRGPTLEDVFIDLMRGGRYAPSTPAAPQLVAPAPSETAPVDAAPEDTDHEDAAPHDAAPEDAADDSAPTPADAVVAVPVAAAAAWAAGTAAAPAGTAVSDDLAAAVDAGEGLAEGATDESHATGTDVDVAAATDAPVNDEPHDEPSAQEPAADDSAAGEPDAEVTPAAEAAESAVSEESPARSFDEILFGAAAPTSVNDASTEALSAETAPGDEVHSGVEIFADLHGTSAGAEGDAGSSDSDDDGTDDVTAASDDAADADGTADDDADADPRSAAVSSMLAAAARAYYEDEPKDYPLGTEGETTEGETADGEDAAADTSVEGAHWTVASTGVIDTVPLAESSDADAETSSDDEATAAESDADDHGEDHDGANHDGDQHGGREHDRD